MHDKILALTGSLVSATLILAGCAVSYAPRGWLSTPGASQVDTRGAWARVELGTWICDTCNERETIYQGELIAIYRDTIFMFSDKLVAFPRESISSISLARYTQQHGPYIIWTLLGTASTISHGFFLLGTAPLWIVTGTIAAASVSKEPLVRPKATEALRYNRATFRSLGMYARFPQGLPDYVDRSTIGPVD